MGIYVHQTAEEFIASLSEPDFALAIVSAINGGDFGPIRILDDPSPQRQLADIHNKLPPALRAKFKSAVVRIIREWVVDDPIQQLEPVVFLAGYIKASDAVAPLRTLLETYAARGVYNSDSINEGVGSILGVLHGFAPDAEVKKLLEKLYCGDELVPRFTGQIFVALCCCDPDNYTFYVPRLLQFVRETPENFPRLDLILGEFVDQVTIEIFCRELGELTSDDQLEMLHLIKANVSEVVLLPTDSGIKLQYESHAPIPLRLPENSLVRLLDLQCETIATEYGGAVE
ncbi:hypothetical protein [Longimicrobium sp.]|uniref:hypothetical protein n=1 Tax=Longimicrobium sp. TaxID=2029185 RepID=UPI002EDA26D7